MTPEQEILADALIAARQRADRFVTELAGHAKVLPLDATSTWTDPAPDLLTEMAAFAKRYEMTQDLLTRRLFRSVLAVQGRRFRTAAQAEVMNAIAEIGIIDDAERWEEITKLRNSLAHDYAMTFSQIVPLLNQAWEFSRDLTSMVATVERFVATNGLLDEAQS